MRATGRPPCADPRPSAAVLCWAFAAGLLVLAGCGADAVRTAQTAPRTHAPRATSTVPTDSSTPSPAPTFGPGPANPPHTKKPHHGASGSPAPESIEDLKQRCFAETHDLKEAFLSYTSPFRLDESDTDRFTARLVADAAEAGLGDAEDQGHLEVACEVQARLVTDDDEVATADRDWVGQQYDPPDETRWTWVVTGRKAGRSDAVVQLRPVVRISGSGSTLEKEELGTESFDVTFVVARSTGSWISSTGGTVVGFASGLAVIAGAVVGVRSLFSRRASADRG